MTEGVVLLLHCEGSDGSTDFVDSSPVGNTMTAGGCTISTAEAFAGASSLYSPGPATDVSCPIDTDGPLDLSTQDFFRISYYVFQTTNIGVQMHVDYSCEFSTGFRIYTDTGVPNCQISGEWAGDVNAIPALPVNQWSEIILQRSLGTLSMSVNGTVYSNAPPSMAMPAMSGDLSFAAGYLSALQDTGMVEGYLDEIEVFTGVAPTVCDPDYASVVLLAHFDGANGSTDFVDDTGKTALTSFGSTGAGAAVLDTSNVAFGSASLAIVPADVYTDPSGPSEATSAQAPITSANDVITGGSAFTIECWFNISEVSAAYPFYLFDYGNADSTDTAGISVSVSSRGVVPTLNTSNGWSEITDGETPVTLGFWNHAAVCRDAEGNGYFFINGVLQGTASDWGSAPLSPPSHLSIGYSPRFTGNFGTGWIDEFRITKGIARYSTNFLPPMAPFGAICAAIVPDVIGDSVSTAQADIVAASISTAALSVGSISSVVTGNNDIGIVISQDPVGGTPETSDASVDLVISGFAATFDVDQTVIAQYANSTSLLGLVEQYPNYFDQQANMAAFYDFVWNINTAKQWGLDIWGRILQQPRVLSVGGTPTTLSDTQYLPVLLAKALANIIETTIPALNKLLQFLFPGERCYVTDQGNMAMTYTFEFGLTPLQLAIVEAIMPHPAGVLVNIVNVDIAGTFGYNGSGLQPYNQGTYQ